MARSTIQRPLSRRQFLRALGLGSGAALLAACGGSPAPTSTIPTVPPAAATDTTTLSVMTGRNEFTEKQQQSFEAANPGIKIEFQEFDQARLLSMAAAGNLPDLVRTQAPDLPQLLARKLLLDLTPYFQVSSVIKLDDMGPANNYYKAESPLKIGSGSIYGMVKDWSPDLTLYAYKTAFDDAKISLPSTEKPLSYLELAELATRLYRAKDATVPHWGLAYESSWMDRFWMNMLAEKNQSLYNEDFSRMKLADNPEARAIVKYFYDLARAKVTPSSLNPSQSWAGEDFPKGTVGLLQYGYWYSALAESDITRGKVMMLPAPTWAGQRRSPPVASVGMVMSARAKNPDAAWKFFEWYMGGEPSVERAKIGWGVPALKSQYALMPTQSAFQKQVNSVLQTELKYADIPLQFNPYLNGDSVAVIWNKLFDQALKDKISFDELLASVERETNAAIIQGQKLS